MDEVLANCVSGKRHKKNGNQIMDSCLSRAPLLSSSGLVRLCAPPISAGTRALSHTVSYARRARVVLPPSTIDALRLRPPH